MENKTILMVKCITIIGKGLMTILDISLGEINRYLLTSLAVRHN